MSKVKKTYRIDSELVDELEKYAKSRNMSQTEALESAIQGAIQGAIHVPDGSHTQKTARNDTKSDDVWRELFLQEHEKLLALTEKVADSLQASQTLQAMDKPAAEVQVLESTTQKMKRNTRWQRLKEAWRG